MITLQIKDTVLRFSEAEEVRAYLSALPAGEIHTAVLTLEEDLRLTAPLVFDAAEEPALRSVRLTVTAKDGAAVTGCAPLDKAQFIPVPGTAYYRCQLPADGEGRFPRIHDFYVDGKRIPQAAAESYINPFEFANFADRDDPENYRGVYVPLSLAQQLKDADLTDCELTVHVEWECHTMQLESIDFTDTAAHEGVTYVRAKPIPSQMYTFVKGMNPILGIKERVSILSNHERFLQPGTFTYNSKTGVLLYCPAGSIAGQRLEIPLAEQLLIIRGMEGVHLDGLTFTGTTSGYVCDNGYMAGQANNEARAGRLPHAALLTENVRDFAMTGCRFTELGGNGVLMTGRSVKVRVGKCLFENIGMSALSIGNPSTVWEDPDNQNISVSVENNVFRHIGYEYPTSVGFYMGMVDGLRFTRNTMHETAYSAVSVGWGWVQVPYELGEKVNIRDAEIAYNRITDYMQILRDGAAIYVLGANCTAAYGRRFNFMHDNYAERELFRDTSKRGYYMDGSASNWEVWDNVTVGCRLPVFSQFHVPVQFTHHNFIHDIYTTDPIDPGNHAPDRDTILGECFFVPEGKETMFTRYPKAKAIADAAGADWE